MNKPRSIIGWREWVGLPEIGIKHVKAKIDTGARTSSLHADDIQYYTRAGKKRVRFIIHPIQRNSKIAVQCSATLLEERWIKSSSGHSDLRPVIQTLLKLGDQMWPIEITLTNRDSMGFRMLLGRQAIRSHFLINPGKAYVTGKPAKTTAKKKRSLTK